MEVNAGFQLELSANKDVIFSQVSKPTDARIRLPAIVLPILEFTNGVSCGSRNTSGIFIDLPLGSAPEVPPWQELVQLSTLLMAFWPRLPSYLTAESGLLCWALLLPLLFLYSKAHFASWFPGSCVFL